MKSLLSFMYKTLVREIFELCYVCIMQFFYLIDHIWDTIAVTYRRAKPIYMTIWTTLWIKCFFFYHEIDINECDVHNGGCQHTCTNSDGSYSCSCNDGYTLDVDDEGCSRKWNYMYNYSRFRIIIFKHRLRWINVIFFDEKFSNLLHDYMVVRIVSINLL